MPTLPGLTDLSPLGRGGFADVYLARQAHLDRWVAAKVFRVTLADRSASDQFQAECQAVGRLDRHPHVITVFEADVLPDGRPYMVTEHCDGSLHKMIEGRGALPPAQVADIGLTVAKALLFAHSAKVLHGDVTPQNILLRSTGAPVLADFGLAVLRDYQGNVASGFTMAHAAPETVRADGAIDRHTDVYGLGSTLYTALTGSPPFPARPGEPDIARTRRVLTEEPARPTAAPPWLADLVLAMLAKEPAQRPTMAAVADALAAGESGAPAAPALFAPPPFAAPPFAPSPFAPQPGTAQPGTAQPFAPPPGAPAFGPPPGAPAYGPPADAPWDPGAVSQEFTRNRPGAAAPGTPGQAGTAPPPWAPAEDTRLRPQPDAVPPAGTAGSRPRWLLIAGVAAVVLLLGGGLAFWLWPRAATGADPGPVAPPVAGATTRIQLAAPVDHGDTVDLSWTADATLDFGVVVGESGQAGKATYVGRVNRYTVTVQADQPYCFRIQGVNPAGTVSESNVESVRNAICRFSEP